MIFDFAAHADPAKPQLLGLVRDLPTYYYDLSLGNASDKDTGIISVSLDFPEDFKAAAVFLPDRTVDFTKGRSIHFQTGELKKGFGQTFRVGIKARDLPDLNKINERATCQAGDFSRASRALYGKVFRPVKQ